MKNMFLSQRFVKIFSFVVQLRRRVKLLLLLQAIFASSTANALVTATIQCPESCRCYQQSGIDTISCVRAGLVTLPNDFNFDVKILNFTKNRLRNLTDNGSDGGGDSSFVNERYRSLEILDLSKNVIRYLDSRSFRNLKNLLEVDLSDNQIRFIDHKLFEQNRFLNTVRLAGNPIRRIDDYAFALSTYIRRLDFKGCQIEHVRRYAFVNTPSLRHLNLEDNRLKSLSVHALHFTPQLETLLLDGNPWRCDKKLWLLLEWLRAKNSSADSSLLCVYGETADAILWDTMDATNAFKFRNYWKTAAAKGDDARVKHNRWSTTMMAGRKGKRRRVRRRSIEGAGRTAAVVVDRQRSTAEVAALIQNDDDDHRHFHHLHHNHHHHHQQQQQQQDDKDDDHNFKYETFITTADIALPADPTDAQHANHDDVDDNENVVEKWAAPDFNTMLILIALELLSLVVLLPVLYTLWTRYRRNNDESGSDDVFLNNNNSSVKNVKTYQHNQLSPGYKRYSLSDDEYANLRGNAIDDAKYDSESGYLSYRRYNSVEEEENPPKSSDNRWSPYSPQRRNIQRETTNNSNNNANVNSSSGSSNSSNDDSDRPTIADYALTSPIAPAAQRRERVSGHDDHFSHGHQPFRSINVSNNTESWSRLNQDGSTRAITNANNTFGSRV